MTNAPISQNPRVVKEADALSAAGYDVTVVFGQHAEWTRPLDKKILERASWRGHAIEFWPSGARPWIRRIAFATFSSIFGFLAKITTIIPIAELAYSRLLLWQLWKAIQERADFYIGHNPQSLPVVAWAAWATRAKFGFDFEDFHQGEASQYDQKNKLLAVIERRYLVKARLITASSWGIAREVARLHQLDEPLTILNVFNWADRAQLSHAVRSIDQNDRLSLYWFSQIISLDRGLQDAIRAMGQLDDPVNLYVRGAISDEVKSELTMIAQRHGVASWIKFLKPVPPEDLLVAAAEYDIGLCLEVPATPNRDNCITNKIFIYMLAGLAVIASETRGHADVLAISPDAGFLYESGNSEELATIISRLSRDRNLLSKSKAHALAAAQGRWNWEYESRALVAAVDCAVSGP